MSKEVKERSWESRGAQKHKNLVVCEISQPKIAPCEIATSLRNDFAAPCPPLRKFSQLRNHLLAHECHFAASYPHFAATKWLRNLQSVKTPTFRSQNPIPQRVSQLRNHSLAHECHLEASYTHFAAAKWLRNPLCLKILQRAHHAAAPLLDTFQSTS